MIPSTRADINRQNASRSTGPVTPEGKRKASLNALRHGLTGQTVVLPEEDLAAYQKHCAQFHAELKPQGLIETKAVQTSRTHIGGSTAYGQWKTTRSRSPCRSSPSRWPLILPSTAPSRKPK